MTAVAEHENTVTDHTDETAILDLSSIVIKEGHNPRKTRVQAEYDELHANIKAKGVLQPILVRPHPTEAGKFQVVAGETRYLICCDIGLFKMPALIRNMTDAEMTEFALAENRFRARMSPMDEGDAATAMAANGYTNDTICLVMGWNAQKLAGRIQLTHCIDVVRQHMADKKLTIGHAQILSGLRPEAQASAAKVIIGKQLTVDGFRDLLDGLSLKLASAPFDTSDCASCIHNSATQSNLFDTKSDGGRCLNKVCFTKKKDNHMNQVKVDLAESYNKVELSNEVANGSTTRVIASGTSGVGQEQLNACAGCPHYGAIIDTTLGNRANITEGLCFNLPCHTTKVADYQSIIATDAAPANDASATATLGLDESASGDTTAADPKAAKAKAKVKAAPRPPVLPRSIVERHHTIHREAASARLVSTSDLRTAQIMMLLSAMNEAGIKPSSAPEGWPTSLHGEGRAKAALILDSLDQAKLDEMQVKVAAQSLRKASTGSVTSPTDTFGSLACWYASTREVDLSKHFVLDTQYLNQFVKPVVGQILEVSGFSADYDTKAGKEGAFKTLMAGKKGDIMDAVDKSGFDFAGFVPADLKLD